jgi:hypothetical protein
MRALFGQISLVAATLGVVGCSTTSALDNGTFAYECVAVPGGSCAGGSAIPATIALGTQFKLTYTASSAVTYPNVTVSPVSTDFFSVQNGVWTALRSGSPAAFATAGGLALDYVFFHVEGTTAAADAQ